MDNKRARNHPLHPTSPLPFTLISLSIPNNEPFQSVPRLLQCMVQRKRNNKSVSYQENFNKLPFTLTRSNSSKFVGYWKLMKAAQWNTQSTPSNACSMLSGSQISPTIDTILMVSLCPNEIIKVALIKLADTQKSENKQPLKDVEFSLTIINLLFTFCYIENWNEGYSPHFKGGYHIWELFLDKI